MRWDPVLTEVVSENCDISYTVICKSATSNCQITETFVLISNKVMIIIHSGKTFYLIPNIYSLTAYGILVEYVVTKLSYYIFSSLVSE